MFIVISDVYLWGVSGAGCFSKAISLLKGSINITRQMSKETFTCLLYDFFFLLAGVVPL